MHDTLGLYKKKIPEYMGITNSQDWSNINQVQVTSSATFLHIKQDPIILGRKGETVAHTAQLGETGMHTGTLQITLE